MRLSDSLVVLALVIPLGCHGGTDLKVTCNPACSADQSCENGECVPTGTSDGGQAIDGGISDAGAADAGHPDAGTGDAGAPDSGPMSCQHDSDCTQGVCNTSTQVCVSAYCAPACHSWETCSGHSCTVMAGRCNTDSDCPSSTPTCNKTNTCVAPQVTAHATLDYSAVIITSNAYQSAVQPLAQLHTLTGVPTQVVTVESICAQAPNGCNDSDPCNDTPKAIKDYLIAHQDSLQLVVLVGDVDAVPARQTTDAYSNSIYMVSFNETFYTDYYYADLSDWDTNQNCMYGEPGVDTPNYLPDLGVTRIPVSSLTELQQYIPKVVSYMTSYDVTNIESALFLSNVAAQINVPVVGLVNVDSAIYFELPGRTLSLVPSAWNTTELFSNLTTPSSMPLTVQAETDAFQSGYNIVVHAGHGDPIDLTVELDGSNEFSGAMAYQLQNTQFPIMVSCACQAGAFNTNDCYGGECAGQQFITNPTGGGIGYLGNSATGLGLAGGSQLVDEFLKYSFSTPMPLVGEAIMAAHTNEPTSDSLDLTLDGITVSVPTIDADSYRWTQKSATFFGDGLIPIYTDGTITAAPNFAIGSARVGSFQTLTFTPDAGPAGTLSVAIGSDVYQLDIDGSGATVSLTVAKPVSQLAYGFSSMSTLAAYQQVTLP